MSSMFAVLIHSVLFIMCEVVRLGAGGWCTCVTPEQKLLTPITQIKCGVLLRHMGR